MNERIWFANIAISMDQKLGYKNEQTTISNKSDFKIVHNFRNKIAAIGVGSSTILIDNPSLTVKKSLVQSDRIKNPVPIIFDRRGRINPNARVFTVDNNRKKIWVTRSKQQSLSNTIIVYASNLEMLKNKINRKLSEFNIKGDVMIEGGAKLLFNLISKGVINKIRIYQNSTSLNKSDLNFNFPSSVRYNLLSVDQIGSGIEKIYKIQP